MDTEILITILIIMCVFTALAPVNATTQIVTKQAETRNLTKSELIELRKTILLQEIKAQEPGAASRFFHKWQLRLLLLTLIAGYLVLRVKGQRPKLKLPMRGWIMAIFVLFLSMVYDAHLASLDHTQGKRRTLLYEDLYKLPNLDHSELLSLKRVPSFTELRGDFSKRWCLRWDNFLNLDSVLFYLVVIILCILPFKRNE